MPKDRTLNYRMRNSLKKKTNENPELNTEPLPLPERLTPSRPNFEPANAKTKPRVNQSTALKSFTLPTKPDLNQIPENEKMFASIKYIISAQNAHTLASLNSDEYGELLLNKFNQRLLEKLTKINSEYFDRKNKRIEEIKELEKQKKIDYANFIKDLAAGPQEFLDNSKRIFHEDKLNAFRELEKRVLNGSRGLGSMKEVKREKVKVDLPLEDEVKDLNDKMRNLIEKIRKLVEYSKMTWKVIDEQKKVNALNALKDFQVFSPVMGMDTAVLMERLVGK